MIGDDASGDAARVAIFAGPTLPPLYRTSSAGLAWFPPAAFGDVYRAVRAGFRVVGIVDGYFERTQPVWHKEILWAMCQGVHVFGSASMGALRAAELAVFGMEGVGRIFEAYRDGLLTDDDEVAVRHGPPELGYPLLSEAMVDIRATLDHAVAARVISSACARAICRSAKQDFYGSRTYERAIAGARNDGCGDDELARFKAWLPTGKVDQKRSDALAMLREIERRTRSALPPKRVSFEFQHSSAWESAVRQLERLQDADAA